MKKALCTVLAVVVLLGIFTFVPPPAAARADSGEAIQFNDPALEAAVRKQLGKLEGDITIGDAEMVDRLDLYNETREGLSDSQLIHDISSLEYFKNLFSLSLYNNGITDISALSVMAGLKFLDLGGNNISDLSPLSSLPLEELWIWGNEISDVTPLGSITTLKRLTINGNQITDFSPIAKLTSLKTLMASSNATLDYTPLADIAASLEERDFEILTTSFDRDEVIAFNDTALESLVRNQLGKPEGAITAGEAANLQWLEGNADPNSPEDTRVRDVSALRYFVNLVAIRLDNNLVSDISALAELPNLRELWVLENPLERLEPLGSLTNLAKLGFSARMRDVSFIGGLTELEELRADGCRELPQELAELKKLRVFCSLGGELADISLLAQIPTLEAVDLSWNLVTDLTPLAGLPLTELYLQGNPIEDFTPIKEIYPKLAGRNFEYIEYAQPENPDAVITFPDSVMEMKVRKAMNIPEGDITAGEAAKITRLDIQNEWQPQIPRETQVQNLQGIEYFINLRELNASFNDIGDISALSGLTQLRDINLGGNRVGDIDALADLINLEKLTLFGNEIRNFSSLSGLTSMRFLNIGGLPVYDLSPLAGLTKIDNLYLGGCGIDDISPLAGMTNMFRLELQDNLITDLSPLAGMANLIKLNLARNPVQDYSPIEDIYPKLQEKDFELGQVFDVQVPLKPDKPEEAVEIKDAALERVLREATGVFDRPLTQIDLSRLGKIAGSTDGMWGQVSDITALKYCLNLEGLDIFGSGVSDLTPLTGLTKLRVLSILDSAVEDITPLGSLKQLVMLLLKGNRITDVSPLKSLTQLERLNVANNQIADFSPLYSLDKLSVLFIGNNPAGDTSGFKGIFGHLNEKDFEPGKTEKPMEPAGQLDQPKDPGKTIKFADKVMERRVREAIGKPEGKITAGDAAMVEELNLGNEWQEKFPKGSQIANLSGIEHFINLKNLDISWNKIKDVKKLSGLARLEYLRAFGNQIGSLTPLEKLVNLRSLNVGGNKLAKIDALKDLVNLTELYLNDNKLTNISALEGLANLTTLNLSNNKIKDFSPVKAIYPQLTEKDFTLE